MRREFAALAAGRTTSAWGDALVRVVLAASAYMQSRSTLVAGLVIVAPGIGGALSRGHLGRLVTSLGFRKLAIRAELLRAVLFGVAAAVNRWPFTIVILAFAGALQPLLEAALSGLLSASPYSEQDRRAVTAILRSGYLIGAFAGAAMPVVFSFTPARAMIWNAASFVTSAVSFLCFREAEGFCEAGSETGNAAGNAGSRFAVDGMVIAYAGAAVGLAIAAPSMPAISQIIFAGVGTQPTAAYGFYQVAILAGMIAGGYAWKWKRPGGYGALSCLLLGVSAPALIVLHPGLLSFSLLMVVSALCENVLVLEIQMTFQTLESPMHGALASARLRALLALISAGGLAVNYCLARLMPPIRLLCAASGIGAALGVSILFWPRMARLSVSRARPVSLPQKEKRNHEAESHEANRRWFGVRSVRTPNRERRGRPTTDL